MCDVTPNSHTAEKDPFGVADAPYPPRTTHMAHAAGRRPAHVRGSNPSAQSLSDGARRAVLAAAAACLVAVCAWAWALFAAPSAVTPFPGDRVAECAACFPPGHAARLLWGTYRPHLYLGVRARVPQSPVAGLMWYDPNTRDPLASMRHTCEHSHGLRSYGWRRHDGSSFGRQYINDTTLDLVTDFAKGADAGDWAVRVAGARVSGAGGPEGGGAGSFAHVFLYIGDEAGGALSVEGPGSDGRVVVRGKSDAVGAFEFEVMPALAERAAVSYAALRTRHTHNLTEAVTRALVDSYRASGRPVLPNAPVGNGAPHATVVVVQMQVTVPFSVAARYVSVDNPGDLRARRAALEGAQLDRAIAEKCAQFDARFERTFGLSAGGYGAEDVDAARAALSNLVGGMGYFYGRSLVRAPGPARPKQPPPPPLEYFAAPLFTAVPSRPFFPRGFMWDEGFHQLLVARWDAAVAADALAHWLDLMNAGGWIPREQILGAEARAKVPDEFVVQSSDYANPPALVLPLALLAQLDGDAWTPLLRRALPRLRAWYGWFNATQAGATPTAFRWRGREGAQDRELNAKTLTSGLDDYPRASHPSDTERHVDLRCWMAVFAGAVERVCGLAGDAACARLYAWDRVRLSDQAALDALHWDAAERAYFDYGNHTDAVRLAHVEGRGFVRRVTGKPRPRFVRHYGYVSLFPLIARVLPLESPRLSDVLDRIDRAELLWTDFGLRSLARNSSMYLARNTEHDAPYWRGPVWVNINYLVLGALRHYAQGEGAVAARAGDLYRRLRDGLVGNVLREFRRSGYLWEQYDVAAGAEGRGKGTHPFTGWTALVVLAMAEQYPAMGEAAGS